MKEDLIKVVAAHDAAEPGAQLKVEVNGVSHDAIKGDAGNSNILHLLKDKVNVAYIDFKKNILVDLETNCISFLKAEVIKLLEEPQKEQK